MYLPDLIEYLSDNLDGFSEERKDTQKLIAKVMYLPRPHFLDSSAVAIPNELLRTLGHSSASFQRINKKYNLYSTSGQYFKGKSSRKYYPNTVVNELLYGFATNKQRAVVRELFKNHKGQYCERSVDFLATGITKVSGLNINPTPKVNTVEFGKWVQDNYHTMPTHYHQLAVKFFALLKCENIPTNTIPQAYEKIPNGRVTGLGVAVQNAPKEMRKALFCGSYDYDFQNCHYAILSQTGDYPTITEYVNNTNAWRNEIAQEIGATVKETKKCLLAMSYGATKGTNPSYCAIPQIIGSSKATMFWKNNKVQALEAEVKIAGSKLTGLPVYDKGLASAQSNKLQGIENEILAACTKDIIIDVPMYDGFIYNGDLDVEQLQDNIKEITGYDIVVTKERIQ